MAVRLEQGSDLLRRSQTMIGQAVDHGTGLLADRVEHYTNVAREVGEVLRDRGEPQAADAIQTLSERGTQIARYLRNNDGAKMWADAQDLARGRTWLLTGMGLVGGLAIARAVRTAADGGARDYVDSYAQPYTEGTGRYDE